MIPGILTAIVFALTAAVFLTKRLPPQSRLRRAARAIHRPMGYALLTMSAAHLLLSLKLFYQRPLALYQLGVAMVACAVFCSLTGTLFRKNAKRGLLLHRLSGLVMALLLAAHILVGVGSFFEYQREMAAISIIGVSSNNLPDGAYEGSCDVGYIKARVKVLVQNGEMTAIDLLEHRNERGAAGEGVLERILGAQTTAVDAVSGATNSSLVIQRAVENALNGQ